MKKNYFMLALASMMMAACANNDLVDDLVKEEVPQAIGFETFAQKATRAELTEETIKNVGFCVWGYKAPTGTEIDWDGQYTVFNKVLVTHNGENWGYDDAKYWDRTSTYNFYAVAPSNGNYSIAGGMITVNDAESAKSTESMDYVIDRDGAKGVNGDYTGTAHDAVSFDFHHIMSKISFKLKAAVAEKITVTNLTMKGWDSGKGTFVQTLTSTPSVASHTSEWNISTAGEGNVTLVGIGAGDTEIALPEDKSAKEVKDMYIMVPQIIAANALTFTIDFKIKHSETDVETFTAQVGKLASKQVWGTDTHTTYTISVGPDVIDFSVSSVCGWDAGKPEPDVEIE